MEKQFLNISVKIKSSPEKVWPHLTQPELIKKYFFGTQIETDWKPGSSIYFRGEYQGKIIVFKPNEKITFSYWSSFSGLADLPENYQIVTYQLLENLGETYLTLHQDNIGTVQMKEHSEKNWRGVLDGLKNQVESI
jgi:uncharacterized protein YndB with AHSA1/START domain